MFENVFNGKKVLVTGNTGFKGSWLTTWLLELGAEVIGISDRIPTQPSMYEELNLKDKILHYYADIRNFDELSKLIENTQPDFLFHLAAQAIVSVSYAAPLDTLSTNVMGTAHVLEAVRHLKKKCIAIIITSDKCYDNLEWVWGYKETDVLGGKDVYSGSKGAAELVFKSYFHSYFIHEKMDNIRIATGRAGNVIGGGDWAKDRIVVDCVRSWSQGNPVKIRSPNATRPWQHVLEPLSGYLALAQALYKNVDLHGESFNFGPRSEQNRTVLDLIGKLSEYWKFGNPHKSYQVTDNIPFHEAGLLKLNCDKALFKLKWMPTLNYPQTIRLVSEWYYDFYQEKKNMYQVTTEQINFYQTQAKHQELIWAN